eukprot:284819538_4
MNGMVACPMRQISCRSVQYHRFMWTLPSCFAFKTASTKKISDEEAVGGSALTRSTSQVPLTASFGMLLARATCRIWGTYFRQLRVANCSTKTKKPQHCMYGQVIWMLAHRIVLRVYQNCLAFHNIPAVACRRRCVNSAGFAVHAMHRSAPGTHTIYHPIMHFFACLRILRTLRVSCTSIRNSGSQGGSTIIKHLELEVTSSTNLDLSIQVHLFDTLIGISISSHNIGLNQFSSSARAMPMTYAPCRFVYWFPLGVQRE